MVGCAHKIPLEEKEKVYGKHALIFTTWAHSGVFFEGFETELFRSGRVT